MGTITNTNASGTTLALANAADIAARSTASVRIAIGDVVGEVPAAVVSQIADLLHDNSAGRVVVVAPSDLPIGTELAAELLGVSRPWITELLDRGDIPMRRTGSKRRVLLGDLIAYRRANERSRNVATVEVAAKPTSRWHSSTPPTDWSERTGPTEGVVELPFHLYWSDDNNTFNLSNRARLRSMYQIVLAEGSAEDVRTYLNLPTLIQMWDDLWLPA